MVRAIVLDCYGVIVNKGLDEAVLELARELKKSYKIAILSNTSRGWIDGSLTESQQSIFDVIEISGETGHSKPDRRAYLGVTRSLEEFPEDCLMIDDSLSNCTAATEVGMQAIHYTNLADLKRELMKYGILAS